jgi:hypothetical protein
VASADTGIELLYANYGILYAIGLGISDYPNNHISTYSGGHWTTLATFTEGYNWGQNALSKYSDLFLATPYYPKRWH